MQKRTEFRCADMNDRPLRILHLTAASDAGGLSRYLLDLCKGLVDQGHEVTLAGERGAWHDRFEAAGWRWIDIPLKGGPLAFYRSIQILRSYLADHPVDLLHAHYRRATLLGRRLQKDGRPPLLYTLHLSHMPLSFGRRWLSDFGDHTHVASVDARQWLTDEAGVDPARVTLIPHGIDTARFPAVTAAARANARAGLGLHAEDRVGVFVGRLDYPKNASWMLDVAEAGQKSIPRLRLLLAGDGPERGAIEAAIQSRGLGAIVTLLGDRDPLAVYEAADGLLLPSLREGFSLVAAEAMSVGIPVLRTRTSGTTETIIEGVTGVSTPINQTEFVKRAVEFLSDAEKLPRMGIAAAVHVRSLLDSGRQLDETLLLYRKLIAR
jgi:glycosyltransferase involved in cell wall biosynthesis